MSGAGEGCVGSKLRERGLLVGDRLRVEQLLPASPHARAHCRQDLQAATNRAPPPDLVQSVEEGVYLGQVQTEKVKRPAKSIVNTPVQRMSRPISTS